MIQKLEDYLNRTNLNIQRKDGLILFDYDRVVSFERDWDDLTITARGLVFEEATGVLVTNPIPKFFNYEEPEFQKLLETIPADQLFHVYEKMDGSCVFISHYKNDWICHTRGSFNSDQAIAAKKWFDLNVKKEFLNTDYTYIAEYVGPNNRIVVEYSVEELVLLLARNRITNKELNYAELVETAKNVGLSVVPFYEMTIEEMLLERKTLTAQNEGWVIQYPGLNIRAKIKGLEYCRLHGILSGLSNKTVWKALKNGDSLDEILSNVPDEYYDWLNDAMKDLLFRFNEIKELYQEVVINFQHLEGLELALSVLEFCKDNNYNYSIVFYMINGSDKWKRIIWDSLKPKFEKPGRSLLELNSEAADL